MFTVKEIHNDFDVAIESLLKFSIERKRMAESIVAPSVYDEYEDAKFLDSIGFTNSKIVNKLKEFDKVKDITVSNKVKLNKESEEISKIVSYMQEKFPFHKFIFYSQVINICEKYGLYLGGSSLYGGDIPIKNINEMKNFPMDRYFGINFGNNIGLDIPKLKGSEPICAYEKGYNEYNNSKKPSMYICAPYKEFIHKGTSTVGKEIFLDSGLSIKDIIETVRVRRIMVKDPIVLLPVYSNSMGIGFLVVTKWGEEANDSSLVVPGNN